LVDGEKYHGLGKEEKHTEKKKNNPFTDVTVKKANMVKERDFVGQ